MPALIVKVVIPHSYSPFLSLLNRISLVFYLLLIPSQILDKNKTRRVDKKRNLRKLKKLIKEGGKQRKLCIFVSEIHTIRKTLLAKTQSIAAKIKKF